MWRKEVLVVALVAICAIMLFASLPASDAVETGGGVDDLQTSTNELTYRVLLDDTEFYDSNTYKDLKQSLNVIDSDGKQYEPEEFQIKGADESDRLPYGSLNVVVVINGNEVSLDENISVNIFSAVIFRAAV